MGVTQYLLALVLVIVAAGCAPVAVQEQDAIEGAMVEESEELSAAGIPEETRERPTAASTPMPTPDEPAVTNTPVEPTEQPAATSRPIATPDPVSDEEAAQIYAAAIRRMTTFEHSFGGNPPDFPLVFILSITSDGELLGAPITPPQKLSPEMQGAIEAGIADLPFEYIWVESRDEVPMERGGGIIADGQGIIITMGNILPQEDSMVHLPFYMVCGSLCLSGKTYVLEEIDGAWQVTDNVGMEVQG
jgi:hypothetical protein